MIYKVNSWACELLYIDIESRIDELKLKLMLEAVEQRPKITPGHRVETLN